MPVEIFFTLLLIVSCVVMQYFVKCSMLAVSGDTSKAD